ncbi:aldose 1-epimerase [Paraliobacillus quinghaiensis]|uniref:Aldose 1-epimerase n=1 Tax=Paraliobacillus quinghaiensis TaxID=470815 RepID=A0A917TQL5_9BACI|nr:aldose epimerase family protein [Paraliobacillus quinghaiensis]GGM33433.1 aldose 1-epimerase [Paraliobacillus quinghaiensis]
MKVRTDVLHVAGRQLKEYTLINANGMEVSCLNYGGVITKIMAPNSKGDFENVVLGYANYDEYIDNPHFFGALIGRVAGRIQDSSFKLNGKNYSLQSNNGAHHLHGGTTGFHKVIWQTETFEYEDAVGIILVHRSPDGDGGYPGNLAMKVTYTLTNDNAFTIVYEAIADQKTVLTTTNHSYFNLSGNLKTDILQHNVQMDASRFVELDHELIPTGRILPVDNTVFDFRQGHAIVDGVHSVDQQNLVALNGFDHYFIFDHNKKENLTITDSVSGRTLTVKTDQPGIVMYTSNALNDTVELREGKSSKYLGVCLETQSSPASLEHDGFPSILLEKDEPYKKTTSFVFKTI